MTTSFTYAVLAVTLLAAGAANAKEYTITLKDKVWTPATLEVTAGEKHKLTVKNEEAAAAEFESDELGREKVIAAKSQVTLDIGPLKAGNYPYFNEFHEASKGTIVAK